MKKLLLIIILFLVPAAVVFAQYSLEETKPTFRERLRFGGGLGLSFGNITLVDVSPRLSYMIHPRWYAGIGVNYLYYNNKYYDFYAHMYGATLYNNYALLQDFGDVLPTGENSGSLLIHAEANVINMGPQMDFSNQHDERFWHFQPMAGLGIKMNTVGKSYALILILYNFNEKVYSPSKNPVINVSIMF
ncbi:MAG: hypothetical protein ACQES1_09710 [Bacteroidota bacterium]